MKTLILAMTCFVLASSCDGPQRTRLTNTVSTGNGVTQPNGSNDFNPWGTTSGTTTGSTTGTSGSSGSTRPAGFENCDITPTHYAAVIGYTGICQSTLDETSIAVNSTVTDTNRTCLIPTYKDNTGSSTYLGQPQCFAPEQNKMIMGKLYKTRSGFTQLAINGLMVLKEASLTAYFTCMDAHVSYRSSQCPHGAQTNSYCAQLARNDMTVKCNDFKATHPYLDIRLKN
jgi:hypothetical protein